MKNFKLPNRIKNEHEFAKLLRWRYLMSNARNKEFVKFLLLDIEEVSMYYNFEILQKEIEQLEFHLEGFKNNSQFVAVIKNDETRELVQGKVFTVHQFFF